VSGQVGQSQLLGFAKVKSRLGMVELTFGQREDLARYMSFVYQHELVCCMALAWMLSGLASASSRIGYCCENGRTR